MLKACLQINNSPFPCDISSVKQWAITKIGNGNGNGKGKGNGKGNGKGKFKKKIK